MCPRSICLYNYLSLHSNTELYINRSEQSSTPNNLDQVQWNQKIISKKKQETNEKREMQLKMEMEIERGHELALFAGLLQSYEIKL